MDLSGQTGLAPESATPCRPNRRDSGFGNGACGAAYVAQLHHSSQEEELFRQRGFERLIGFGKRLVPLVIHITRAFTDPTMPSEEIWMRGRRRWSTCGNPVTASS